MKKVIYLFILISLTSLYAQDTFIRSHEIPVPTIENTGLGEMVAGVDFDGDGRMEIYSINNMLDQLPGSPEEIPKIYKFEFNPDAGTWDSVWMATIIDIPQQNSWGAITTGDWDQDGKPEIIWAPANWTSDTNPNPPRILVFEAPGDGSEGLGVEVFGNYKPNCQWSIVSEDNANLRPFVMELADIDSDGDVELCFADRVSTYAYGVISVSDIPDNGDGSETWTLETSGFEKSIPASYDMAIIENTMYLMHDDVDGSVTLLKYTNGAWNEPLTLADKIPGGSWKTSSVVDVDGDGSLEIVVGGWSSAANNFFILKPDVFEVLKSFDIATLTPYISDAGRLNGGAAGDIDQDGKMDIVFGTRGATPAGAIVRIEYQGGDISDGASYTFEVIDSLLVETDGQRYDVVKIANVDDDNDLEVIYTDGNQINRVPIAILDFSPSLSVNHEIVPSEYYLSQNYPNPFNPSTTIQFGLNQQTEVSLKIYDILGREIASLINNEVKSAGTYEVTFDASVMASGTYIYKLTANNQTISKKMNLIK